MPVDVPLWMVAVATAFAVIIGKEVFGGTGMNILNPALTTRAFLFFAYPSQMSGDVVWIAGLRKGMETVDGFSGATILGQAAQGNTTFVNGIGEVYTTWDMFLGIIPGSIGETSTLAILDWSLVPDFCRSGQLENYLLRIYWWSRYGTSAKCFRGKCIHGYSFLGTPDCWVDLHLGQSLWQLILLSAAQTERGKWIYGFLIGFLAILIRVLNPAYPEGVMLAILLMNVFAPLIDHYVVEGNIRRRLKRAKVQA